jgi:hypothetical protein
MRRNQIQFFLKESAKSRTALPRSVYECAYAYELSNAFSGEDQRAGELPDGSRKTLSLTLGR